MSEELDDLTDDVYALDERLKIQYKKYRNKHPKESELSLYMYAFLEGMRYVKDSVELIVSDCIVRDEQIFEKSNGKV